MIKKLAILLWIPAIIFLIVAYFSPIQIDSQYLTQLSDDAKSNIEFNQLDLTLLSNDEANMMTDYNYQYLDTLNSSVWVNPSRWVPEADYERDSSYSGLIASYELNQISWNAYLFYQPSNDLYHVIVNYELPVNYTGNHFIQLHFSQLNQLSYYNYNLCLSYNDQEYYQNQYLASDITTFKYDLPDIDYTQWFKSPVIKGYYDFAFELSIDSPVFYMDIDLFEQVINTDEELELGFNSFKSTSTNETYNVERLSLTYTK